MSIAMPQHESSSPAPKKRRFVMTEKRLAANRRNARKSTGPRTEAGKRRSAQNGKPPHPVCSDDAYDRLEGTDVYGLHLAEMAKAFEPRNLMQAQLFPQLVGAAWELNRINESQVKLIEKLREDPDELPCEVIARVFASGERNNPLVAAERYWRSRQTHYWRMVKQFEIFARWQRSPDPNFKADWEDMLRREAAERAWCNRQAHLEREEQELAARMSQATQNEESEPIGPDENGDSDSESQICAIASDNTNPLEQTNPSDEGVPPVQAEGVAGATSPCAGKADAPAGNPPDKAQAGALPCTPTAEPAPCPGEAIAPGEIRDIDAQSPFCANGVEKTNPLQQPHPSDTGVPARA